MSESRSQAVPPISKEENDDPLLDEPLEIVFADEIPLQGASSAGQESGQTQLSMDLSGPPATEKAGPAGESVGAVFAAAASQSCMLPPGVTDVA